MYIHIYTALYVYKYGPYEAHKLGFTARSCKKFIKYFTKSVTGGQLQLGRCHEKLKAKDKRIRQDALNETTLLPNSSSSNNEARRRISRCRRLSRVDAAAAAAAYKTFYSRVIGSASSLSLPFYICGSPTFSLFLCHSLSHSLFGSAVSLPRCGRTHYHK